MEYGKCLTVVYRLKNKLSPVFKKTFLKFDWEGFDLLQLDVNSWDFFIKSLNFLKTFHESFDRENEASIHVLRILMADFENIFPEWESIEYLDSLIRFSAALKDKIVKHYYIETVSLFNFLASIEIRNTKDMASFLGDGKSSVFLAFHLPENGSFTINLNIIDDKIKAIMETEGDFYHVKMPDDSGLLEYINNNKALKVCFNAISYTECFTENVRDGVPLEVLKNTPKSELSVSKILSPIKEIDNFNSREISAHFRHSHFRFCGSDYYKAKKGKWVFVKGAMVNADAKTITD